jgi:UDP-N-acetylmuramyl tripeptide synthase
MNRLGRFVVLTAVVLVLGLYVTPAGFADDKGAGAQTTVTGCLQKGDEAKEFSITGEDGKTYGLRSSSLDLSQHLGHKVTVTGTLKAESYEKEKKETKATEEREKKASPEAGDVTVTNLTMVSDSCK